MSRRFARRDEKPKRIGTNILEQEMMVVMVGVCLLVLVVVDMVVSGVIRWAAEEAVTEGMV